MVGLKSADRDRFWLLEIDMDIDGVSCKSSRVKVSYLQLLRVTVVEGGLDSYINHISDLNKALIFWLFLNVLFIIYFCSEKPFDSFSLVVNFNWWLEKGLVEN